MDKEELDFLLNNQDKINQIVELEGKLTQFIAQRAYKLCNAIPIAHMTRKWVYGNYDVGFHYDHGQTSYKLECIIVKSGIYITICVESNRIDFAELEKLHLFKHGKGIYRLVPNQQNTRMIIEDDIPFLIDDNILVDKIKTIINLVKISETQ